MSLQRLAGHSAASTSAARSAPLTVNYAPINLAIARTMPASVSGQRAFASSSQSSSLKTAQTPMIVTHAKRREIEAVDDFGDMFMAMAEKCQETGFLPKLDTLVLIQSMRSAEQAQRMLQLIAKMLQVRPRLAANNACIM